MTMMTAMMTRMMTVVMAYVALTRMAQTPLAGYLPPGRGPQSGGLPLAFCATIPLLGADIHIHIYVHICTYIQRNTQTQTHAKTK